MNNQELINLVSSIASLILAVVAMWQAMYFYNKSKDSEKNTALTLESIKTQSAVLERLTAKWMDRFTKYVTSPKPADETTSRLLEFIQVSQMDLNLLTPQGKQDNSELIAELISSYLAIYYYVGLTNIAVQSHLPLQIEDLQDNDGVKILVDQSHTDYFYLKKVISGIDSQKVSASKLAHLYSQAESLETEIRDTTMVYQLRAKQSIPAD